MQTDFYSDEDLVAYIDGECTSEQNIEIQRALQVDTALNQRLSELNADLDGLGEAFAQFSPDASFVAPVERANPTKRNWYAYAASVGAAVCIGAVGSAMLYEPTSSWQHNVAKYQVLYSPHTLADVDLSTAEQQEQLTRVAAAIGKDLSLDDLSVLPGVIYARAQLLHFQGRPLVQIAFTTLAGASLALCILEAPDAEPYSPKITTIEGLSAATWAARGQEYILIGGTDNDLISRMATIYTATQI